jgi:hypothetical protein
LSCFPPGSLIHPSRTRRPTILRVFVSLAVAYAKAYKAERDARGQIQEADSYAASAWGAVKLAAQESEFAREGVALIPREKSWLETIKSFAWPFQPRR